MGAQHRLGLRLWQSHPSKSFKSLPMSFLHKNVHSFLIQMSFWVSSDSISHKHTLPSVPIAFTSCAIEQEKLEWVPGLSWCTVCGGPGTSDSIRLLMMCCLSRRQLGPSKWQAGSITHNHALPLAMAALYLVWSCVVEQEELEQVLGSGLGACWGSLFPLPCFWSKQDSS